MWKLDMFKRNPRPSEPEVSGISIFLLQKKLERFSTERLQAAMEAGWHRPHDPVTFFATSVGEGEGAVIKLNAMFITMMHYDRRVESRHLGDQQLPEWAEHSAYSTIEYKCPGGIPEGETRDKFYSFLGLLYAELLSSNIPAVFFLEEKVFVPNVPALGQTLRSKQMGPFELRGVLGSAPNPK